MRLRPRMMMSSPPVSVGLQQEVRTLYRFYRLRGKLEIHAFESPENALKNDWYTEQKNKRSDGQALVSTVNICEVGRKLFACFLRALPGPRGNKFKMEHHARTCIGQCLPQGMVYGLLPYPLLDNQPRETRPPDTMDRYIETTTIRLSLRRQKFKYSDNGLGRVLSLGLQSGGITFRATVYVGIPSLDSGPHNLFRDVVHLFRLVGLVTGFALLVFLKHQFFLCHWDIELLKCTR